MTYTPTPIATLTEAYKFLIRYQPTQFPSAGPAIRYQEMLATCRDSIAKAENADPEAVQNYYERKAREI